MLSRKNLFRLSSILLSLLATLFVAEFGAYLSLQASPNFQLTLPPPAKEFISKYEISESLSRLPIINTTRAPNESFATKMYMELEVHRGLIMPPKSKRFSVIFKERKTDALVWEAHVTTDEFARRRTSLDSQHPKEHIIGFGGSRTWGHGVSDNETILAYLSDLTQKVITYNVAFEGYGPSENLIRIKSEGALDKILPKKGIGLYFYFPDHYLRFVNSFKNVGTWRPQSLELEEPIKGQFVSKGPIAEVSPTWVLFSKLLASTPLFQLFDFDWPLEDRANLDRMVRVFSEMKNLYQKKTDSKNLFVIVLLPDKDVGDGMRMALDRAAISYIDYSTVNLRSRLKGPSHLPGDSHPTPEINQKLAQAVYQDLKKLEFYRAQTATNVKFEGNHRPALDELMVHLENRSLNTKGKETSKSNP